MYEYHIQPRKPVVIHTNIITRKRVEFVQTSNIKIFLKKNMIVKLKNR